MHLKHTPIWSKLQCKYTSDCKLRNNLLLRKTKDIDVYLQQNSKSIFPTSDSFPLIMSHIYQLHLERTTPQDAADDDKTTMFPTSPEQEFENAVNDALYVLRNQLDNITLDSNDKDYVTDQLEQLGEVRTIVIYRVTQKK